MNSITSSDYDYETLKCAILETFQLTPEKYRQKFREMNKTESESVKSYITKLGHTFDCWVKYSDIDANDAKSISQLVIREQILEKMPEDMRTHLMHKKILDTAELAKEAEEYASVIPNYWKIHKPPIRTQKFPNSQPKPQNYGNKNFQNNQPKPQNYGNKNFQNNQPKPQNGNQQYSRPRPYPDTSSGQRFGNRRDPLQNPLNRPPYHQQQQGPKQQQSKGQPGVNTPVGPHARVYKCDNVQLQEMHCEFALKSHNKQPSINNAYLVEGQVEGRKLTFLRDTGSTQTVISKKFVPDRCLTGSYMKLRGIASTVQVPMALVQIKTGFMSTKPVPVAVVEGLDYDGLLGNDLDPRNLWGKQVLVMTRAQKEQEVLQEVKAQNDMREYTQRQSTDTQSQDVQPTQVDVQPIQVDVSLPQHDNMPSQINQVDQDLKSLLESNVKDLIEHQQNDDTLEKVRKDIVKNFKVKDHDICYYKQNGIIMRKCQPQTRLHKQVEDQIVLPQQYREHVIEVAHDKTGHLGVQKTQDRITQHFYWPGLNQQVRRHCQVCEQCQYLSKNKQGQKQPLQPLPIIDIPFKRIGIDIAGPLPVTEDGNKYLLVICDYATRYPEAIPMPDQTAKTLAQALITVFSRVGLPSEIVHDQGTNLMSRVMAELCQKLGIDQIPATPYHQQTNGLTERFIGTLKLMINSLTEQQKENWDKYIPLFMFSYREVPCEFTGYSPFHLLYGRQIRGPLSLIKEGFLEQNTEQDIPSHLLAMSYRLTKWMADANKHKQKGQTKMKLHYDQRAKEVSHNVGEQVLVFLPEGAGKLDAKWQGPYEITRKIGDLNYEIHMPDKRKSKRILHANLIKKWYSKVDAQEVAHSFCITGVIQEIGNESLGDRSVYCDLETKFLDDNIVYDLPVDYDLETQFLDDSIVYGVGPTCKQTQTWKDVKISNSLTETQNQEISELLEKYSRAFSDVPGRTNVISHTVKTTTETPIRQKAYRTPH